MGVRACTRARPACGRLSSCRALLIYLSRQSVIVRFICFKIQIRDPYELLFYRTSLTSAHYAEPFVAYDAPMDLAGLIHICKRLKFNLHVNGTYRVVTLAVATVTYVITAPHLYINGVR